MKQQAMVPRVGEVRPSQLMYSAGVGALVDLPRMSVIVGGLDGWNDTPETWREWCGVGSVPHFKFQTLIGVGGESSRNPGRK